MENEEIEFLSQNLRDLEDSAICMQSALSSKRKRELWIRQRLQEIGQDKDPGVYLFKPVCNWNVEEEKSLKDELEEVIRQEDEIRQQIEKLDLQRVGFKKCCEQLRKRCGQTNLENACSIETELNGKTNKEQKDGQSDNYYRDNSLEKRRADIYTKDMVELRSISSMMGSNKIMLEEIYNQLKRLNEFDRILYSEIESAGSDGNIKKDQVLGGLAVAEKKVYDIQEFMRRFINYCYETVDDTWDIYTDNNELCFTEEVHFDNKINTTKQSNETNMILIGDMLNRIYLFIRSRVPELEKMFHVKHIMHNNQVCQLDKRRAQTIYKIAVYSLICMYDEECKDFEVELSITGKEVELFVEYMNNKTGKMKNEINCNLKRIFESEIKEYNGEIILAVQKIKNGEEKNSLLAVVPGIDK